MKSKVQIVCGMVSSTDYTNLENQNEILKKALRRIEKWFDEFPPTGRYWDHDETDEMSYTAAYGSNGERDYMMGIASEALKQGTKNE